MLKRWQCILYTNLCLHNDNHSALQNLCLTVQIYTCRDKHDGIFVYIRLENFEFTWLRERKKRTAFQPSINLTQYRTITYKRAYTRYCISHGVSKSNYVTMCWYLHLFISGYEYWSLNIIVSVCHTSMSRFPRIISKNIFTQN